MGLPFAVLYFGESRLNTVLMLSEIYKKWATESNAGRRFDAETPGSRSVALCY
jgi:hypothetical protein